jgi:hypothetical protein
VLLTLPTAQLNPTSTPTIVLAVAARAKAAFTLMVTTRRLFGINFCSLHNAWSHPLSHPLTAVSPSHYTQQFSIFPI